MTQNLAISWYKLVFSRWFELGVRHAFISPGYRDAPLIAALLQHGHINCHSCFDERAAAYMGLGVAKTSDSPAILVCTSGTAGANYFPAVIEAAKDQIPLLVVTADRPFELIYSGANQVMPQSHLYGSFTKAAVSFPEPNENFAPLQIIQYADFLWSKAMQPGHRGPVHLNAPLREPLEPTHKNAMKPAASYLEKLEAAHQRKISRPILSGASLTPEAVAVLGDRLKTAKRGLLVLGRAQSKETCEAGLELGRQLGWPILADVTARLGADLDRDNLIVDPETHAAKEALLNYGPDVVLHFGHPHLSKWTDQVIAAVQPAAYFVINDGEDIQDQTSQLTQRVYADPRTVARSLLAWWKNQSTKPVPESLQVETLKSRSRVLQEAQKELLEDAPFSFYGIARTLLEHIPEHVNLLVGNSSAIRAVNSAAQSIEVPTMIYVNRGVSGIEGHVATAIGLSIGNKRATVVLLGDISLIHDLNSLFALKQSAQLLAVVVVNNKGGGIFKKLPIKEFPEILNPYIATPHQFCFEKVAEAAGLNYLSCADKGILAESLKSFVNQRNPVLIECQLDDEIDSKVQLALHDVGYLSEASL